MADPQTPAPAATPSPFSIANWTYPRLPQPFDIIEGVTSGGGGPGGGPSPSTTAPQMDGAASAGSAAAYSRGDHRHPSDTSRLATAGGTMTGYLTLLPPTSANHAATKNYVDSEVAGAGGGGTPSDANPQMDGAATPGTSTNYSRGDHRHPSDTSKQNTLVGTAIAGQNLKTVNGTTLLGSGDVTVTGGGGTPSDANPAMDGTAAPGTAATFARGDHVHPSDTTKQNTLVSGTNIRTVNGQSLLSPLSDLVISGGGGTPSDINPAMNGTAAPGVAAAYSRGDHVHPTDTSRQATLVDSGAGQNIKTINTQSILGSGNLTITGGAGGGHAIVFLRDLPYPTSAQYQAEFGSPPVDGTLMVNRTTGAIMYWDGGWTPCTV